MPVIYNRHIYTYIAAPFVVVVVVSVKTRIQPQTYGDSFPLLLSRTLGAQLTTFPPFSLHTECCELVWHVGSPEPNTATRWATSCSHTNKLITSFNSSPSFHPAYFLKYISLLSG